MNVAERLADIKNQMQDLKDQFHGFLEDVEVPLEERWQAFCDNSELLNYSDWVDHTYEEEFGKILALVKEDHNGEFCWYDDMYVDRYQQVKYADIIQSLEEENVAYDEGHTSFWTKSKEAAELINDLKERMLADADGGFTYDW